MAASLRDRRRDRPPTRVFSGPVSPTSRRSAHVRRRGRRGKLAVTLVAVACLVAALIVLPGVADGILNATGRSTPRSDWRRGEVPYLYQTDSAWADEPYAGSTVSVAGCGPTCLSMVYVDLTGRTDLGPAEMSAFSERNGFVSDGMTAWSLMTDGAALLGLDSRELAADVGSVTAALESGSPVICSVAPGDFTSTGHFIVLAGIADDGGIIVHDPNSAANSSRTWDAQRIVDQCKNLWAFSA